MLMCSFDIAVVRMLIYASLYPSDFMITDVQTLQVSLNKIHERVTEERFLLYSLTLDSS